MSTTRISLADAKARFSEITRLAAAGETVIITKRGRAMARLSRAEAAPEPIDLAALRRLTDSMTGEGEDAGEFMRGMRDEARY